MAKRVEGMIERTVQVIAQEYLEDYYQERSNPRKMYGQIEMYTKSEYGGKRADGFLCYPSWFGKIYVVSMESKSFKTLPALTSYLKPAKLILASVWVGFLASLGTGSLYWAWNSEGYGLWKWVLPIGIFLVVGLLFAFLMRNHALYHEVNILKQVMMYPGNERWISFSRDSIDRVDEKREAHLMRLCKERGIGVLVVSGKNVRMIMKPKRRYKFFGDYLQHYNLEEKVRNYLKK